MLRDSVSVYHELPGQRIRDLASDGSTDRWRFDSFELWDDGDPSSHITHEATLRGSRDRVAIVAVPDDRTAGIALIDTAARAAARRDFRRLVVVAFHYEADVKNEQRRKLDIVLIQANRDLTIDELRSGKEDHAFVLVGEPDVEMVELSDGKRQVKIKGYNVYDPGSGNVRLGGKRSLSTIITPFSGYTLHILTLQK